MVPGKSFLGENDLARVTQFAKETGDNNLSKVDKMVIAAGISMAR